MTRNYSNVILKSNPVAYWPLEDASGTVARAIVGSNGAYVNSPTLDVRPGPINRSRNGVAQFSGSNHVSVPYSAGLVMTTTMSAAAWVLGAAATETIIAGHYDTTLARRSWKFSTGQAGNTNKLCVTVSADGAISANYKVYHSDGVAFDSTWHHVAFTFSSGALILYVDGVAQTPTKTVDLTCNSLYAPTNVALGIASVFANGSPIARFTGKIAHVVLCNDVMSAEQIKYHYLAGKTGVFFPRD